MPQQRLGSLSSDGRSPTAARWPDRQLGRVGCAVASTLAFAGYWIFYAILLCRHQQPMTGCSGPIPQLRSGRSKRRASTQAVREPRARCVLLVMSFAKEKLGFHKSMASTTGLENGPQTAELAPAGWQSATTRPSCQPTPCQCRLTYPRPACVSAVTAADMLAPPARPRCPTGI